jgi:hypothetical protein
MKKNKNKKELIESYLSELVRTAHQILSPQSHIDELNYFMDKNNRDSFKQRYPNCFHALKYIDDREDHLLPLCNRSGSFDANMIRTTIVFVKKFRDEEQDQIDVGHLDDVLLKLSKLEDKYKRENVKTGTMAYRKGFVTKNINHIKKYLEAIRNKVTKND